MKIECVATPDRKLLKTILCDEEEWKQIHTSIFGKSPALPKNCETLADFAEKFSALEYTGAKNYALRRLSAQSLPSPTLFKALKERCVSEATIERLLHDLQGWGYLKDEEWAASFVRVQLSKKVGLRTIAQKLAMKGLSQHQIEEALQHQSSDTQQKEAIVQLMTTRYRKYDPQDFKQKQKLIAALARRGFDFSLILECV